MKRILLVDDDKGMAKMLEKLLSSQEMTIDIEEDGSKALVRAIRHLPDLIISDISMPVMDGFKLCHIVKNYPPLKHIPFIFLTGVYDSEKDRELAIKAGANAILIKPADPEELLGVIADLLYPDKGAPRPTDNENQTLKKKDNKFLGLYNENLIHKLEVKIRETENILQKKKDLELRLVKNKTRLLKAQRLAKIGDFVWDLKTDKVSWSEPLYEMMGYSFDEKIDYSKVNREIHYPEDQPDISQWLSDTIRNSKEGIRYKEYRLITKNRGVIHAKVSIQLQFHKGEAIELIGTVQDISDLRKAENALKDSENRYQSIFQNNHANMLILDPGNGQIIDANPAALRFYGWSLDEIRSMNIGRINTLSQSRIREEMELARHEKRKHFYFKHRLAEGSVRDVEVFSGPIKLNGRQLLFSIIHDITEKRQAERALADSEVHFRTLADNGRALIWTSNQQGDSDYMNKPLLEFIGKTSPNTEKHKWIDFIHPEDLDKMRKIYKKAFDKREKFSIDIRLKHVDGVYHWIQNDGSPRYNSKGEFVGFMGHALDISRRRNLEDQLRQAQKMESVGRLAGGVAHDFNNILQVIMGDSEMLLTQLPDGSDMNSLATEIQTSAMKAAALTRQLLAFARKQTITPKSICINEIITNMLKILRRLIGENITLGWEPAPDLYPVYMDPGQVDQILANLCVNARDAIKGTGSILIRTSNVYLDETFCEDETSELKPGDYCLLSISDDGCGMSSETLEKIFEPFFTTKSKGEGTGLGLSTVYGIIKQNKGHIDVSSEAENGSEFRIYLPKDSKYSHDKRQSTNDSQKAPGGKNELILIVEDDMNILELTRRILESLNYRVICAESPEAAIEMVRDLRENKDEINLLITDVIMPEMSGRQLYEEISRISPQIRELYISGYTSDIIAKEGIHDKLVHFLQKPFSKLELSYKIREILNSEPPA